MRLRLSSPPPGCHGRNQDGGSIFLTADENGMRGSMLYRAWLDIASWLPVVLLEGTAVGLILGRLYWFKGTEQQRKNRT